MNEVRGTLYHCRVKITSRSSSLIERSGKCGNPNYRAQNHVVPEWTLVFPPPKSQIRCVESSPAGLSGHGKSHTGIYTLAFTTHWHQCLCARLLKHTHTRRQAITCTDSELISYALRQNVTLVVTIDERATTGKFLLVRVGFYDRIRMMHTATAKQIGGHRAHTPTRAIPDTLINADGSRVP